MGRDLYSDDEDGGLTVRAFHGGIERGQCVQIGTRNGFVQLDRRQAEAARAALRDFLVAPADQDLEGEGIGHE